MRSFDKINDFVRDLKSQCKSIVERKLAKAIYIAQVEDVDYDDTLNLNFLKVTKLHNGESVENVKIGGIALGNYSGIIKIPKENDFGLVIEVNEEPFWLMNVLDVYTDNPDRQPLIKDSMIIQNQQAGSFIIFSQDDNITIKTQEGAKVIFKKSGSFKLFDKENYGIESDGDGNIIIRGNSINFTQTKGEFEIE